VTLRLRYKVDRPSAVMETGRGRPIWVVGAAQELYGASACWPSSASAYLLAISPSVVDGAGERAQFRRVKTQKYKESDGSPLPRGSTAGLFRKHGRVKLQNDRRTTETLFALLG
jgi:hypothetical protein